MSLDSYLKPENSGSQRWQMVKSNLTPGTHPYNFKGFCMALVAQWLLEIRFQGDRTPDELGRFLLQNNLGPQGYQGIANSQDIYGAQGRQNQSIDEAMIERHSGGALRLQRLSITCTDYKSHWLNIRCRIYQLPDNDATIRLEDRAHIYSGIIGIGGDHNRLLSLFMESTWAHAIGVYSDATHIYVFDPNYGIFIFEQHNQGIIAKFIQELWKDYGVTWGDIADIVPTNP